LQETVKVEHPIFSTNVKPFELAFKETQISPKKSFIRLVLEYFFGVNVALIVDEAGNDFKMWLGVGFTNVLKKVNLKVIKTHPYQDNVCEKFKIVL